MKDGRGKLIPYLVPVLIQGYPIPGLLALSSPSACCHVLFKIIVFIAFVFIAMARSLYRHLAGLSLCIAVCACATTLPYHGFPDQATLDARDTYVIKESAGGSLDPMNLALEDQQYEHNKIAYGRVEEGYYQWGQRLYKMGYRDEYYVRDLAPNAFRHALMDVYDHAIMHGFEDAQKADR